jgi:CheY-like chemotaxis protein
MPSVLICCTTVSGELPRTLLWRDEVERRLAHGTDEAIDLAASTRFNLIVVHHALPDAGALIRALRTAQATRMVSIAAVMSRREFEPADLDLIQAGANAILRPPLGPDWDQRLATLMRVPPRRIGRFPIELRVEATTAVFPQAAAGTVLNLSERGMLIETDVPLTLGSDIDFRIHLRDAPAPLRGCGQLIRQDTPLRGGVAFYALEAHGLARVRRFVRR